MGSNLFNLSPKLSWTELEWDQNIVAKDKILKTQIYDDRRIMMREKPDREAPGDMTTMRLRYVIIVK